MNGRPECLEIKLGETDQECDDGFIRDSGKCIDLDECRMLTEPCGSNEVCINIPGNYTCECRHGYERRDDNKCSISKILAIWGKTKSLSQALLTDFNGDTNDVQFGQEGEVSAYSSCSLNFKNQFFILG